MYRTSVIQIVVISPLIQFKKRKAKHGVFVDGYIRYVYGQIRYMHFQVILYMPFK